MGDGKPGVEQLQYRDQEENVLLDSAPIMKVPEKLYYYRKTYIMVRIGASDRKEPSIYFSKIF